MSQVIVTADQLVELRKKTLKEEKSIPRAVKIKKWQLSDATKTLPAERAIGVLTLPLFVFWAIFGALFCFGASLGLFLFKIGSVLGLGKKD